MEWHRPPFLLKEIKIEVTHDCDLRCIHCSSIATENSGRSIDWSSCKRIIGEASQIGVKEIAFSGGEPLLWGHIGDAINLATQLKIKSFLYTTGNAPEAKKTLIDLHATGLSRVMFSLFGADAEQHEQVTESKGSYEKTLAVASQCVAIGMDTELHFVPLSHNYKALQAISEQARKMRIKQVSVLRLVPQGRGADGKGGQLTPQQNLELRSIITDLRSNGHPIRLGSPYNFLMLREKPKCCAGIDRLTIGPDLRIYPCDAFKHISPEAIGVGSEFSDLHTCSLAECWEKSAILDISRKYLTTEFAIECQSCQKISDCLSGCMAQKYYAFGELKKCPDPMCLLTDTRDTAELPIIMAPTSSKH